jgi:hypothetical protein
MKTVLLAGATVALLTAANFAPAMAQGPKLSAGTLGPGSSSASTPALQMLPRQPRITSISTDTISTEHGGAIGV